MFLIYLKGFLTITVSGRFCERFINVCASRGILLWNVVRISDCAIRCRISVSDFKKISDITTDVNVTVQINIKHGLPFLIQKYKKRHVALLGCFIFIVLVIVSNLFVWKIEITGNKKIPQEKIISVLKDTGLKKGMLRSKIDPHQLQRDTLLKLPELAWLWVYHNGSKVIVDVRENIEIPKIYNHDDYTNIIAKRDGIIETMTVRGGIPVLSEGDTVLKDTVIVTGKVPSTVRQENRYIRADAEILARVWYEEKEIFSGLASVKNETGKKKTHFTLHFFDKDLNLFKNKEPFEHFLCDTKTYSLFGIGFTKKTYKEVEITEELQNLQTVADYGITQLKAKIESQVSPNSLLRDIKSSYKKLNKTSVEVTVIAEYLEDIAVTVPGVRTEDLN